MLTLHEFQTILINNGGKIIDNISPKELEQYKVIKEMLYQTDVSIDKDFQDQFASMHHFSRKRIGRKIRKEFFQIMEDKKNDDYLDIIKISRRLYNERPRKHFKPKHFSLVTRLMHTIHENYPIYNNNVAAFFEYIPPKSNKIPLFRKLSEYISFYEYLIKVYREALLSGKLYDLLKVVEIKNRAYKDILNQSKNLDLVVRTAGDLKKKELLVIPRNVFQVGKMSK